MLLALLSIAILLGMLGTIIVFMKGEKLEVLWEVFGFLGPFPFWSLENKEFPKFAIVVFSIVVVVLLVSMRKVSI